MEHEYRNIKRNGSRFEWCPCLENFQRDLMLSPMVLYRPLNKACRFYLCICKRIRNDANMPVIQRSPSIKSLQCLARPRQVHSVDPVLQPESESRWFRFRQRYANDPVCERWSRKGRGAETRRRGGSKKGVMNHESFSSRRGGARAGIQICSLIISQDVEWH